MSQGRIKHLFPGGNTSLGFFSYYNNIISQEDAERIFILKGGPGVGKSTFMKRMGEEMQQRGYDVEFLHCSSDNNSLDGLTIPALKIAFMDGTSPHVVDPKTPGAVDEILNFGQFWNEVGIHTHKESILNINREIGYIFGRAYYFLKAAQAVYEDSKAIYERALEREKFNAFVANLLEQIFTEKAPAKVFGTQRSLFVSAITPKGLCNYLDTILTTTKVYEIKGGLGTGEERILEKINENAIERGYHTDAFYCAFNPYKLEHLVIPKLDVSFTTSNPYHHVNQPEMVSILMEAFFDQRMLKLQKENLSEGLNTFDHLLSIALKTISKAKEYHDDLETYYIPHIDFDAVDRLFEKTLEKVLQIKK